MTRIEGFGPLATRKAHTLILGSVPSEESLRQRRYYAHPRNAFWPLIAELLGIQAAGYAERVGAFKRCGYALWDVLQACERPGSLDSSIVAGSAVPNDFAGFLDGHPHITRIFFNGSRAEAMFRRFVQRTLPAGCERIRCERLPSTSPAHAGLSLAQKREHWRAILASRDA